MITFEWSSPLARAVALLASKPSPGCAPCALSRIHLRGVLIVARLVGRIDRKPYDVLALHPSAALACLAA